MISAEPKFNYEDFDREFQNRKLEQLLQAALIASAGPNALYENLVDQIVVCADQLILTSRGQNVGCSWSRKITLLSPRQFATSRRNTTKRRSRPSLPNEFAHDRARSPDCRI